MTLIHPGMPGQICYVPSRRAQLHPAPMVLFLNVLKGQLILSNPLERRELLVPQCRNAAFLWLNDNTLAWLHLCHQL